MTSKHWALVGGAVACLFSFSIAAAPWLEPGDPRARFAAQKLADRGHLDRGVTTWPLMWATVHNGLESGIAGDHASVGSAAAYLRFEKKQQASPGFRAEVTLAGTNDVPVVQGFEQTVGAEGLASVNLQWQGEHWAAGLKPAYAHNPEDDESLRLDNSYLAATAGNWVFGAGAIDRWWGPGWQSSLILSDNARPLPAVWLNRKDAHAPQTDWLEWIGPWQFTVFAGQFEEERAIPDAKLIGMRLTLRPVQGLDIGFSRAIMFGGQGRPEGASTIWNALIGRDNGQLEANDPGNQLGSIDVRYGFALGQQSMGLYGQMMGEDEAGAFPARKSWLLGLDMTSQLFGHDQQWFAEYTNTMADDFPGDAIPNITYDHSRYRSGYRYNGRTLGASIGGDSEAMTLGLFNFFPDGRNASARLSYVDFNKDGANRTVVTTPDIQYAVAEGNQKAVIASLGYGLPLLNGWLDLNTSFTDKKLQLINGEQGQWSAGATWRYRF
ncbi:MAG TPA: capsule assembly Wzi family protein [Marinobacter sp.]|uniref:capsule assembly Wzi family protein n=1 Tax=Marinobacter sp. TaxID=50741 RepID=UPI002D7E59DA|nr:capsule assembly Wzi family protein [Marinobacter sp.]HET8802326.1 capsule assembly Wzi family protein [Marinobacter sp.]